MTNEWEKTECKWQMNRRRAAGAGRDGLHKEWTRRKTERFEKPWEAIQAGCGAAISSFRGALAVGGTHSWPGSPVCAPRRRAAAGTPAVQAPGAAASPGRSPSERSGPPGPPPGNPSACAPAPAAIVPGGPRSEWFLEQTPEILGQYLTQISVGLVACGIHYQKTKGIMNRNPQ